MLDSATPSPWGFYNPVSLEVGRGCRTALEKALADTHAATLLVVASRGGRRRWESDPVLGRLAAQYALVWYDDVTENPDLPDLQAAIHRLGDTPLDAVVAFGGGSAQDAAKVIRQGLARPAVPLAEQLGHPQHRTAPHALPLFAVPTTAGTGSEVTPFATVWDRQAKKKHSLAGQAILPSAALVDSELMDSLPAHVTLSTGLDAINQAAESLWNRRANPLTTGLAIQALVLGMQALPRLINGDAAIADRDRMAEASTLAGLAISQTRTALCHAISYPLTAHFGVAHGMACAFTMPAVLAHNLAADDGRFVRLATALGCAGPEELLTLFEQLNQQLGVRDRVRRDIPSFDALLALQDEMFTPGRADNNLSPVTTLEPILRHAWGDF